MTDHTAPTNRAEADRLYHATAMIADRADLLETFVDRSRTFRQENSGILNVSYGARVEEVADIFLPRGGCDGAPVHIFLHGGYWYQFGKDEWSFLAEGLTRAGVIVVIPRYSLCPTVSVPQILEQMRALLAWCHKNISAYGGSADRITVSGHSAGGHLAIELLLTRWHADFGIPDDLIKGVTAISAIYDVRPIRDSYVQEHVFLSGEDARRISPVLNIRPTSAPLVMAVAEDDPPGFHEQLNEFANGWRAAGNRVESFTLDGCNHLNCLFSMTDGAVLDAILDQCRL